MASILLICSVIIFACVIMNKVSRKLGIPVLLAFIIIGMLFGTDGIVKIDFEDYEVSEWICSTALIFIMFYGGFGTNWEEAKPVSVKAIILSSLGVVMTAGLTGAFCYFVLNIELIESLIIGSVISSTDAASVFSILRSKRLNLKYNTASLLEVESGSNDPFSYMLTVIMIAIKSGQAVGGKIAYMVFAQLVFGMIFGFIIAALASWILKRAKFATSGFEGIFVLGIALLSYAAPAVVGGNGYLSAYIVGIVLGNIEKKDKCSLVAFFDGITGLMQMLIFFLLGLLSTPSRLPQVIVPALLISLFLTFVSRPVAVFALLTPFKSKVSQQLLVSWTGLRGAASIVFAIMVTMSVEMDNDIFHIVFCIVLFSILLQGSLIPFISKKLNMIDNNSNVMRTFTDYSDETPVQFIEFTMLDGHPWCNSDVKDITLPPETIIALVKRENYKIVPNGDTRLLPGDLIVLGAKSPNRIGGYYLTEHKISEHSQAVGKKLSEIKRKSDELIIMIQRDGNIIIPKGDTIIKEDDILVINHSE